MAVTVERHGRDIEAHDVELTSQRVELTVHGAAIKQLLEERKLERDHAWQIKLMALSVFLTEAVQLYAVLRPHHQ